MKYLFALSIFFAAALIEPWSSADCGPGETKCHCAGTVRCKSLRIPAVHHCRYDVTAPATCLALSSGLLALCRSEAAERFGHDKDAIKCSAPSNWCY